VYYTCLVTAIPVRELNQDTAGVLARVERGETLEITRHQRVIARLVPVLHAEIDDLVAAGRMLPPTGPARWQAPQGAAAEGQEAGELIRHLRDEERFPARAGSKLRWLRSTSARMS
jgi:prevent-host-death family protein